MRRGLVLLCAAVPVLLPAAADAANGVRVVVNGRGGVVLSGAEVDAARDVPLSTRTTTRRADGTEVADGEGGTQVSTVIELAHIPARFVRSVSVPRVSTAGSVDLSGDEVRDGFSGDPSGETRFASIYTGYGHGVHFFRPLRDGSDVNDADEVNTFNDADLTVQVTTTNDAVRSVVASADDPDPDPGQSAGFSVRVADPPDGVTFTYAWDFGDGTTGAGPTPAHAFAAGHYRVVVTAVGDDGSSGVATPIELQVGSPSAPAPAPAPSPSPSAVPTPTVPASGAPGGGGPGAGGGAPTGGGEGDRDQRASGPRRSRGRGDRTRRAPAATATPAPSAAPVVTATATPAPAAPTRQPREPRPAASPRAAGVPVEGVLLAGAGSAAAAARLLAKPEASERSAARRGGGGGGGLAGWLGGGALAGVLLGVGALREGTGLLRGRVGRFSP